MLKALQRIEAGPSQPRLAEPPGSKEISPTEAAVEAAFTPVEKAAATADDAWIDEKPLEETSPENESPQPDPVESAASEESSETEESAPPVASIWRCPALPTEEHTRAYRGLAESILANYPPEEAGVTLMFTSPADGGGTTETLTPLAAAMAEQTGKEVLLVDANLREPALAESFGVVATDGLADVLMGAASWQEVVRQTSVPHLSVLPGVEFSNFGSRLPERLDLKRLLAELRRRFPMVLIDAASLSHREVAPLARHCTGTFLVVRLRQTARRAVGEAVGVIEGCGGRVLGCVAIEDAAK